jgi:hypothetical protein
MTESGINYDSRTMLDKYVIWTHGKGGRYETSIHDGNTLHYTATTHELAKAIREHEYAISKTLDAMWKMDAQTPFAVVTRKGMDA